MVQIGCRTNREFENKLDKGIEDLESKILQKSQELKQMLEKDE